MKKELFARAQRNRNKMKYKTMKPPLQKDFITANTIIKDKTIKSNDDDNNYNKGSTSPLVNTGKEIVIKNTNVEDKYFNNSNIYNNSNNNHSKDNKSASSIVLSGSNYNKMVPEVGVVVKQDNQSKNGGLNFQNQFGKMSVKEYEQLRAMYMNGGNSGGVNHHSSNSNYSSSQYNNNNNHVIVRDNSSERSVNNVNSSNSNNNHHYPNSNSYAGKYLYKRSRTDDTMVNSGNIMHYNWNDQPLSYNNNNNSNSNNSNINSSSNTYSTYNGILNEDLFKGRKIHQLKTNNIKRNSVPHNNMYNYSLPINLNYYNTNNNTNTNTNTTNNNMVSTIPLRKLSPSNNRSRRKF